MLRRRSIAGDRLCGVTAAKPDNTPLNTPSSELTSQDSTQMVMASGSQTIRPVSMYFLKWRFIPVSGGVTFRCW